MFTQPTQLSTQIVKQFTQYVRAANIPKLTCIGQFYNSTLVHILERRSVLRYEYSPCLCQLLVVLNRKIEQESRIMTIYPEIKKTINALLIIIDTDQFQELSQKVDGKVSKNKQLQTFRNFYKSQQIKQPKLKDNWCYKDQESKKILNSSELVNQNLNRQWANVVDKVHLESDEKVKEKRMNEVMLILRNSKKRSTDCLGCVQYFLQHQTINLNKSQQEVIVFLSAKIIKNLQHQLKQSICSLLNNNGGFILFACEYYKMNLIAKGQSISQVKKQSILQQFTQIFSYFVPQISFSTNAQLSFVPIAKTQQNQQYSLIEGLFSTRLKVWSSQRQKLYFYDHMGQILTSAGQQQTKDKDKDKTNVLSHRQILREIKRRFRRQYMNKKLEEEGNLVNNHFSSILHKCKKPEITDNLIANSVREVQKSSLFDLEKKYKYTSIVLMQKISIKTIINFLVSQNISRFQFMPPETEFTNDIRLLFHDTSPYKIKEMLENYKNHKGILRLLLLDNAIQLKTPLNPQNFKELRDYLRENVNYKPDLKCYCQKNVKEENWFLYSQFKVEIYYVFTKLRTMNFHGSKLVKLEISTKKMQQVYSA